MIVKESVQQTAVCCNDNIDTAPALHVQNVSVIYAEGTRGLTASHGKKAALSNVSFCVERGERVAIIGPNGAGKSTLFNLIVGKLQPNQGEIALFGHDYREHMCIAYVPQRSQIDWRFPVTVEDVVMMGRTGELGLFRWPSKTDKALVKASLARVNALHLAKKQIGELSGGQQQRVFIARALAQEASILMMDEPLTGLDIPTQQTIFEILDSLQADGVTVLVATHDLHAVSNQFDRVLLLNQTLIAYDRPNIAMQPEMLRQAYGGLLPAGLFV